MNTDYTLNPFLRQVAAHYLQQAQAPGAGRVALDELCFILPNRRSVLFLQSYFKQLSDKPLLAPMMVTINDFLYKVAGESPTDRVTLLLTLYDCYRPLRKEAEPLDEFIFWGDVLLGDFSDIDKYYCNPKGIFTNISEFKEMDAGLEALNERQKTAIRRFMANFNPDAGKGPGRKHDARHPFRQIWDILYPLYVNFNKALDEKGYSYEGRVYRRARDRFAGSGSLPESPVDVLNKLFPRQKKFVFTGLNMLTECEHFILKQMGKRRGLAEFCWDYPGDWIADAYNRSSFMRQNIEDFPQAFPLQVLKGHPHINVLPIASATGQTRQIPAILTQCGLLPPAGGPASAVPAPSAGTSSVPLRPESCALVLPDEGLLMSVLNAIPTDIESINVTMGFPMGQSEFHSFLGQLTALQLNVRSYSDPLSPDGRAGGDPVLRFYHKPVWGIFASPIFKLFYETEPALEAKVKAIKNSAAYYIPRDAFAGSEVLEKIFRPVLNPPALAGTPLSAGGQTAPDPEQIRLFAQYLKDIILYVGPVMSRHEPLNFETGFAKAAYAAINQLAAKPLPIRPATFVRLVDRIVSGLSIPFEGEPLKGLQVMGPLESRCLDFEHLIIFSCNEGVFPRKSVSSSFIPVELRRGFGLPTYDHQDAMWAYYFYRMIARAREVWLLYDNRTEGLKRGEESRFIKQLRYHLRADMTDWTEVLPVDNAEPAGRTDADAHEEEEAKTPDVMEKMADVVLSATSVETYATCPMKFYFQYILKLSAPAEVAEYLDNGMLGTVFHHTMEALYTGEDRMRPDAANDNKTGPVRSRITADYIRKWLCREDAIRAKVNALIRRELKVARVQGRNIVMAGVITRYVLSTLEADLAYLRQNGADHFNILDLEYQFNMVYLGSRFNGKIDRIDSLDNGKVRVIDYKTGSDEPACLGLTEDQADKPFADYKFKAAIQFHLYDEAVIRAKEGLGFPSSREGLLNAMYVPFRISADAVPQDYEVKRSFAARMEEKIETLLRELKDEKTPFRKTEDAASCGFCDFKSICGR